MPNIEPYIRLVCEGRKTEPNYFNGLLRSVGIKRADPAFKAKDNSPLGVVREAKDVYKQALKDKIPADKVFIFAVFDCDRHAGVSEAIEMLRGTPVKAIFSNISFEVWILLHFERTQHQFIDCDEVVSYLENHYVLNYTKSGDHFEQLKNRIPAAIAHAKWLNEVRWKYDDRPIWERNPYTDVHKAVSMIQQSPANWAIIFDEF